MNKNIIVKGAKENNLKNINVEIPRDKLVVFTGLSGSGKSCWHLKPYMPRGSAGTLNPYPHMPECFWDKCKSRMWNLLTGCHPQYPSTRKPPPAIPARRWEQ